MKCQNCGENDANVKYTQIINGVKKQMNLCDKCAKELGIDDIKLNMSINFSNIWDDMFDMYDDFMPTFPIIENIRNLNGYRGNVETTHSNKRTALKGNSSVREDIEKLRNKKLKEADNEKSKIEILKQRLEKEIKEERFEDAAKTRDEIKKLL